MKTTSAVENVAEQILSARFFGTFNRMKTALLILFLTMFSVCTQAATIQADLRDLGGVALNTPVQFVPQSNPQVLGGTVNYGVAKTVVPINGLINTNIVAGIYTIKVQPYSTANVLIPTNDAVYNLTTLLTNLVPTDGSYTNDPNFKIKLTTADAVPGYLANKIRFVGPGFQLATNPATGNQTLWVTNTSTGGGSSNAVAAGSNVTITTNIVGGVTVYTVSASLGGGAVTFPDVTNVVNAMILVSNLVNQAQASPALRISTNELSSVALQHVADPVIWDEDMNSDCDDWGGLATAHALMTLGKIRIIATGVSTMASNAPYAMHAANWYFGRPWIGVGSNPTSAITGSVTGVADVVATNFLAHFVTNSLVVENVVSLYRKRLAAEANNSVRMFFGGQMLNLNALWNSAPDTNSPLTGYQLVTNKVAEIVIVGGQYPAGTNSTGSGVEYNLATSPGDSLVLNQISNVTVTFVGYEAGFRLNSSQLIGSSSPLNPVKQAYDFVLPTLGVDYNTGRGSWAQLMGLWPYYGTSYGITNVTGRNFISPSGGTNLWTNGVSGWLHRYLVPPSDVRTNYLLGLIRTMESHNELTFGSGLSRYNPSQFSFDSTGIGIKHDAQVTNLSDSGFLYIEDATPVYFRDAAGFAVNSMGKDGGGTLIVGAPAGTFSMRSDTNDLWLSLKNSGNPSLKFVNGGIQPGSGGSVTVSNLVAVGNAITAPGLTLSGPTASRVAIFNAHKDLTNSAAVDTTELEYLDGVTSSIQGQLDGKAKTTTNNSASAFTAPSFVVPGLFKSPTNTPSDGQYVVAVGTAGDTKYLTVSAGSQTNDTTKASVNGGTNATHTTPTIVGGSITSTNLIAGAMGPIEQAAINGNIAFPTNLVWKFTVNDTNNFLVGVPLGLIKDWGYTFKFSTTNGGARLSPSWTNVNQIVGTTNLAANTITSFKVIFDGTNTIAYNLNDTNTPAYLADVVSSTNGLYRPGGTDVAVADGGTGISSGTSGGVLYFSGSTTIASSAALAANALVIGGGAGAAPSTTTTGAGILTFLGTPSSANLLAAVSDELGSGSLLFNNLPASTTFTNNGVYMPVSSLTTSNIDWQVADIFTNKIAIGTAAVGCLFSNVTANRSIIVAFVNVTNDASLSWPATVIWYGDPVLFASSNSTTFVGFNTIDGKTNGFLIAGGRASSNFTAYAAGTVYSLTATPALLDFGTTDPTITINTAGTYLIQANVGLKYNGATFGGTQTATLKLRKTSGTPADITSGSRTLTLGIVTGLTGSIETTQVPPVIYTAAAGDIIQVFGSLSATPSAGTVDTDSAEIIAVRLK